MKITSSVFNHNDQIPQKYTCKGEGINPFLSISEIPSTVKSLVLIMDDPDAPNGTFIHWVVYNINPNTKKIKENTTPSGGVQGLNSLGKSGYVAPCPPFGVHRYFFKIYALNIASLDFKKSPNKEEVEKAMNGHIIDQVELIGLFGAR